jgi:SpoVK/Ycf46/Vps4 family AAA+-type ATPase
MDGVVEAHGRIVIATANNPDILNMHKVLMRPGRFDMSINISYCTLVQAIRIAQLFYPDWQPPVLDTIVLPADLSPATVVQKLQVKHPDQIIHDWQASASTAPQLPQRELTPSQHRRIQATNRKISNHEYRMRKLREKRKRCVTALKAGGLEGIDKKIKTVSDNLKRLKQTHSKLTANK